MTYTPVIPAGGYVGWAFLQRTFAAQKNNFVQDAATQRDETYFREKIGSADSAEKLVGDRRLLSVALTAFGLDADLPNKAFIRKVLEGGTLKADALANRLADNRYFDIAKAFGYGDFPKPNTLKSDFADKMLRLYESRKFETAVGAQDDTMRLALNAQRELADLAGRSISPNGKWYLAMGSPPLRSLLQTAFGLPPSFTSVDIDKQLQVLKDRSQALLGQSDPAQFKDPAQIETLIRVFMVRSQVATSQSSTGSTALGLLQQAGRLSRYI
jgi:hypothetical protein